jgi:hypothetical protein
MNKSTRFLIGIGITMLAFASVAARSQIQSAPSAQQEHKTMHAQGEFEVKMSPQAENKGEGASLGRMSLDKQFRGDLVATSTGEMLTAMTPTQGSAVYVAIERVTGALHGKRGTFALAHTGTMNRGAPHLTINIVPDSGSGELAGIAGHMTIKIEAGKHFYELEYTL